MKTAHLAHALLRTTEGKSAKDAREAADRFVAYLRARRLHKLLPAVLREYESAKRRSKKAATARFTVAKKSHASKYREAAGAGDAEVLVDEGLVGGYILETEREYVDASYRGALLRLYRQLFQ